MNFKKLAGLILFISSLGIASGILIGKMSFFRLKNIKIELHNADDSAVVEVLSYLKTGLYIYDIKLDDIEKELESNPNIKDLQISIEQNTDLFVKVYGRYPILKFTNGLGMDSDGFLMNVEKKDLMEVEIKNKKLLFADRIIPPAGVLLMPAKLLNRGYEFPLIDRLILTRNGLLIKTVDNVDVFIGDTNFLEAYKIMESLKESIWWNKNYFIDLSIPGEILMKKMFLSNGGY